MCCNPVSCGAAACVCHRNGRASVGCQAGEGAGLAKARPLPDDASVEPRFRAGRVRPVVDDPQQLPRRGPHDLEPRCPPWMLPGRVALQVPGGARAVLAQRATPLPPQPQRVVVGKQLRRPAGAAGGLAVGAQQQRKDALDLKERPVGGPAEGATRPPPRRRLRTTGSRRSHPSDDDPPSQDPPAIRWPHRGYGDGP
jgi:hypothetical protein